MNHESKAWGVSEHTDHSINPSNLSFLHKRARTSRLVILALMITIGTIGGISAFVLQFGL